MPLFYISMAGFAAATIVGLYFISRPRLRKINLRAPASAPHSGDGPAGKLPEQLQPTAPDPSYSPLATPQPLPRPPRIISPLAAQRKPAPAPSAAPMKAIPEQVAELSGGQEKLEEIFKAAGYIAKQPPKVGGLKLNLWAIGSDEVLYMGIADPHGGEITANEGGESKWTFGGRDFTSPVWKVSGAAEKIRALFSETLDSEIQITVKPFVVMNDANIINRASMSRIWEAFGVDVFDSMGALQEFMKNYKNREIKSEEQEDFNAYSEYIDTVANYFNKT